jgi:hypothetical protein
VTTPSTRSQLSKGSLALGLALGAALFLGSFAFVLAIGRLKLPNDVEGQLLYEASRIRRGLPLYVDPLAGAFDDGPLPIRKYVLYTPVWPLLTSAVPTAYALVAWRTVAAIAWFLGILALAAWPAAPPGAGPAPRSDPWADPSTDPSTDTTIRAPAFRPAALLAALSCGGFFLLARSGFEAKPDTVPALLSACALARTLRHKRLDPLSAALFAVAALTKPNMVGVASGVFLCDAVARRTRSAASVAVAAIVAGGGASLFAWSSHGAWLVHLHASAMMPISPYRWVGYLRDYAALLGLPHAVVAALAWRASRRARTVPYGPAGLTTSIAWACFAMGKHGSGTAYWLEPTMAMVAVLAYGDPISLGARGQALAALLAPIAPLVLGAMSAPFFWREWNAARRDAAHVEDVRAACGVGPGEAAAASDTGLEMALTGRVTWAPWATTFLVRSGAFPLSVLEADYARPALACFVDRGCDTVTPEPVPFDPGSEHSIFRFELRDTILRNFQLATRVDGECVFRRRTPPQQRASSYLGGLPGL